jgi:DNA replication protein DnaC
MSDEDDVAEAQSRIREMRAELWDQIVPARFAAATLEDLADQPDHVRERITEWSNDPAGRNLILGGPVGVGKTHTAIAACRPLWLDGTDVEFHPVGELLDLLRPGGPQDAMDRLVAVPILIIDDLGSERATDWTAERLYNLVNRRWLEALPIAATSNLDKTAFSEALGERVYSRLTGDGAVGVKFGGQDRRRQR